MKHFLPASLLCISILITSCASPYRSVRPESLPYSNTTQASDIEFSYAYDVLSFRRNKKYTKKEMKKGLRVVAVKITNNNDKTIRLHDDFELMVGNKLQTPLTPQLAHQSLKQGMWIYLLYLPANISVTVYSNTGSGRDKASTTFLPTGIMLAGGNLIAAATANKKFKEELMLQDLTGKTIEPGKTVYGLVTVQTYLADPIQLKMK